MKYFFFLEYAVELCIIPLIEEQNEILTELDFFSYLCD
jgi:hypothetical protein